MIRIVENFTGFPGGVKRHFKAGQMPVGLSAEYEALLISKGHAVVDGAVISGTPAAPIARANQPRKKSV